MKLEKRPERSTVIPIRPQGNGYAVDGPGFYIWEADSARSFQKALTHGLRLTLERKKKENPSSAG